MYFFLYIILEITQNTNFHYTMVGFYFHDKNVSTNSIAYTYYSDDKNIEIYIGRSKTRTTHHVFTYVIYPNIDIVIIMINGENHTKY